jgi:hypothetical protein
MDWFFYSEKQNQILKRNDHNVNMVIFQNYFLKRNNQIYEENKPNINVLIDKTQLKSFQSSFVSI